MAMYYRLIIIVAFLFYSFSTSCMSKDIPFSSKDVKDIMQKVSNWQIEYFTYSKTGNLHDYGIDAWTNGVLYIGMSEWAELADDNTKYYKWLNDIGSENNWQIPANFKDHPRYQLYHADELCIGQFYLNMFDIYKDEAMIRATKDRVDWIMNNEPNKEMSYRNKQVWSWCDALFMAPPVYAHIGKITGEPQYLSYMDEQFKNTYNHLYDKEEGLFYRDGSYFDKRELNGEKIFWGRGNGWVAAGLVNILKILPEDSEYRPFYKELFVDLVSRLADLQSKDGFWHASLLDPDNYPSPETSATAMITYALAYGINTGLLKEDTYFPVAINAWNALISSVDESGKLGWVQPIGADPKKVTREMTAVYGVGAFLLAGTEMYQLIQNTE